jgi:hypothetical protein
MTGLRGQKRSRKVRWCKSSNFGLSLSALGHRVDVKQIACGDGLAGVEGAVPTARWREQSSQESARQEIFGVTQRIFIHTARLDGRVCQNG